MPITNGAYLSPIAQMSLNTQYNIRGIGMARTKNRLGIRSWSLLTNVYYSIDYYSFTIPTEKPFDDGMFFTLEDDVIKIFVSLFDDMATQTLLTLNWTHEAGSRFYDHRLRHDGSGVALSYGKLNAHLLVELSGLACSNFDAHDLLLPLISKTAERSSRIDFAIDIETQTDPKDFIDARHNNSFKSSGHKISPSGTTYYIGGRTSERMARVYRYTAPHPRHNLLRVEAEYKGDACKTAAKYLDQHTLQQTCVDAHHVFGWEHGDYKPLADKSKKITYKAYNPQNASTVNWLYGTVITALRKAIKAGLVEEEDWLKALRSEADDSPVD